MTVSTYDSKIREIGHHIRDCDGKKFIIINQTNWYDADKWTDETAMADYIKTHRNDGIETKLEAKQETNVEVSDKLPSYGTMLAEKIRTDTTDFSKITAFEKFVLNNGYKFKTEDTLRTGYDRAWKCSHDILITESEFITEAGEYYEPETLKAVYSALHRMVEQKKITNSEIYRYAYYKWCLRNPEAIIAYQEGRDKWLVNNCDTEVSEDEAKVAVNSEWGFEVSRVKIIGTPYYDATDYQYIRFDCAHMTWLWANGNLYQVYAD